MVEAVAHLLEEGRVKIYCVDSFDAASWNSEGPLEDRARRHALYEDWILNQVVPWIHADSGGPADIMTVGASLGAYHSANFAFKRADLFPIAMCMSGVYDVSRIAGGERGDAVYFNNPMDYVAAPRWRSSRLAPRPHQPPARVWPGSVGGHDRRAGEHQAIRRVAWARRGSDTRSISGDTTSRTTGLRGGVSSPITFPGSVRKAEMEHVIGMLLGTEEDWPSAFEGLMRRLDPKIAVRRRTSTRSRSSGSRSSPSTCARRRAIRW